MDSSIFLGYVIVFRLTDLNDGWFRNIMQFVLILIDFLTFKYMNEYIENKDIFQYQFWFYIKLLLVAVYKPIRYKDWENPNEETKYAAIIYGVLCLTELINAFIVVLIPYPVPPAELILVLNFTIASIIISACFILIK
jgi:hypothetical protein